ncbi:unnamed protein product [Dibothriocephalus latus]|uniref:BEN domain-containing protein n=1 Tax=Dibothriocephalus latus TaxID=60516 RepID=A0A3P7Q769_DIBLA|nr:unnamed protein product [Dibothriocephalus latus]
MAICKNENHPTGQVVLSENQPSVTLPKEVYQSLIIKSSASATRLIRLLMKSFFNQEELAASSLSGEGIYKKRLQPEITEAIKGKPPPFCQHRPITRDH